jgi:5-methylcytosine-specific restriction protein A
VEAYKINTIVDAVYSSIGAHIRGSISPIEARKALVFWFENYERGAGPTFTIHPTGLKWHTVILKFGAYATPCIHHITSNADLEAYQLAYALLEQLSEAYDLKVNSQENRSDWKVSSDLTISVRRKVINQLSEDDLIESIHQLMIPLIAAMAELIGYSNEDKEDVSGATDGHIDGAITRSIMLKRERNPRNRLLCLRIHGAQCGVCGDDPKQTYGNDLGTILEVHHIEPLSEAETPKVYNPKEDLIPLCPNCHRAIHRRKPAMLPSELKEQLEPWA